MLVGTTSRTKKKVLCLLAQLLRNAVGCFSGEKKIRSEITLGENEVIVWASDAMGRDESGEIYHWGSCEQKLAVNIIYVCHGWVNH